LEAARRRIDILALEREQAVSIANDLQVRTKYLQQERDEIEMELRTSERDITKLKSVIKVGGVGMAYCLVAVCACIGGVERGGTKSRGKG
jgi:hypothetical protein